MTWPCFAVPVLQSVWLVCCSRLLSDLLGSSLVMLTEIAV